MEPPHPPPVLRVTEISLLVNWWSLAYDKVFFVEMRFRIAGPITGIEVIARGSGIRELQRLRRAYGGDNWRKLKGFARIELKDGRLREVELHWYEAHGIGRKELKVKRYLG